VRDYEDRLAIATPEGVRIELVLGGLGSRFTAALLDLVLKAVLFAAVFLLSTILGEIGVVIASVGFLVIYLGYDIAFEVLAGGRTPGKRRTGLRVLRADGRSVDLLSSAIRNVVRLVDGLVLLYLPGMVSILVTRRNQRLGDLAGNTIVVNEAGGRTPAAATFAAATSEGDAIPMPAFLPPADGAAALDVTAVTAQDVGTLRAFLARREGLDPRVRADLAARLSGAVRPRIGGATEHLGAEELVERVVAAKDGAG